MRDYDKLTTLVGDDRCERFADAFARWIIESKESASKKGRAAK